MKPLPKSGQFGGLPFSIFRPPLPLLPPWDAYSRHQRDDRQYPLSNGSNRLDGSRGFSIP
jgi:hypothetical protein